MPEPSRDLETVRERERERERERGRGRERERGREQTRTSKIDEREREGIPWQLYFRLFHDQGCSALKNILRRLTQPPNLPALDKQDRVNPKLAETVNAFRPPLVYPSRTPTDLTPPPPSPWEEQGLLIVSMVLAMMSSLDSVPWLVLLDQA